MNMTTTPHRNGRAYAPRNNRPLTDRRLRVPPPPKPTEATCRCGRLHTLEEVIVDNDFRMAIPTHSFRSVTGRIRRCKSSGKVVA